MNALLGAALSYAARGWPVVPLVPGGKVPASLVRHGVQHATTDCDVIRYWWSKLPQANIGLACAAFLVVDMDPRNDGEATLAQLLARHGALPPTPSQRSGSGGLHALFQRPSVALRGKLARGVDLVHGPRRYIVAAPSVHPSGNRYEWLQSPTLPLAPLPAWIIEVAKVVVPDDANDVESDTDDNERMERARRYLQHRDPAIEGQGGDDHTYRTCGLIARGFGLTAEQTFAVMRDWNLTCRPPWPKEALRRKIVQALEHSNVVKGSMLERKRSA